MKKSVFVFLLFSSVLLSDLCFSQKTNNLSPDKALTPEQQLIYNALYNSVFIVRQDYVVKSDNPETQIKYNNLNTPFYGRIYGIGVRAQGRIWVDQIIKQPWETDSNYIKISSKDLIAPELKDLSVKNFKSKYFSKKEFKIIVNDSLNKNNQKDSILNSEKKKKNDSIRKFAAKSLAFYNISDSIKGLKLMRSPTDSIGWMLIASYKDDLIYGDTVLVDVTIYQTKIKFNDTIPECILSVMPVTQKVIGGAYFIPKITDGGIDFIFAGVLMKKGKNWIVAGIPKTKNNSKNLNNNSKNQNLNKKPIQNQKKGTINPMQPIPKN